MAKKERLCLIGKICHLGARKEHGAVAVRFVAGQ